MIRRASRWFPVLAAVPAVVGCAAQNGQARIDRLEQEKAELQQKNYELKTQIAEKEAELDSLKAQPSSAPVATGDLAPSKDLSDSGIAIEGGKLVLPDTVIFSSGTCTLTANGKKTLDKVAGYLKANYPAARIHVMGHTDTDPLKRTRNVYGSLWDLSGRRASTVTQYLVESTGVDAQKIFFSGFGENRPKADNKTTAGKAQNRRVEIAVLQ